MSGKRKKDNGFSDDIRTVMPFRALLDHEWHMIPALLRNYSRTSSYDQLYCSAKTRDSFCGSSIFTYSSEKEHF